MPSTSVRLDGTANSRIYAGGTELAPNVFTAQAWIKTNTTSGGRILGFGDLKTGTSGHRDRHVYMLNDGRLAFGVWAASGMRQHRQSEVVQRQPVAPGHGDARCRTACSCTSTASASRPAARSPRVSSTSATGGSVATTSPTGRASRRRTTSRATWTRSRSTRRCCPSSRSTPSGRPAAGRRCSRRHRPTPTGPPCTPTSRSLYWRLGEASGTAANDSSASLSPGHVPGQRVDVRADRGDHRNDQHGGALGRHAAAFVSSNTSLRRPTDLLDRDLVQVDVDAGRQADRLREQPDRATRRPPTGTSTCRTTASSSSAS